MSPLSHFDKVFIINLASRADRRTEMQEQLHRIDLSLSSPGIGLFEAIRPVDAGGFPSVGAHGCFLSHLQVITRARDEGLKSVLILEDDLNFCANFVSAMSHVSHELARRDWAFFYGGHQLIGGPPVSASSGCAEVPPTTKIQLCHFYAVRGEALELMPTYLHAMLLRPPGDPDGGPMHFDGACNWFRMAHPHLRTLIACPELGYQRPSRTDIHALKWHDRWPVARQLSSVTRKLRNMWSLPR